MTWIPHDSETHEGSKQLGPECIKPSHSDSQSLVTFVATSIRKYPKNLLRLFFRINLARQKITSNNKNNLARLFLCLF